MTSASTRQASSAEEPQGNAGECSALDCACGDSPIFNEGSERHFLVIAPLHPGRIPPEYAAFDCRYFDGRNFNPAAPTSPMNLHEYQSKELFASYGIPVPKGLVAATGSEAAEAARKLGGTKWVVKAQVHAGGRGKAGGVKLVDSPEAADKAAEAMIGQRLVTHQTGPEGLPIRQVYVEQGSKIARELYLSLVLNRDKGHIAFIASAAGGMDIEEVAEHTPEKITRVNINPATGLMPSHSSCDRLRSGAGRRSDRRVRQDRAGALQAVPGKGLRACSKSIR